MRIVVTGAAGFIGSHMVEYLARQGHEVVALDCFLEDSYSAAIKRSNWKRLSGLEIVDQAEVDLRTDDLRPVLRGADCVVNEAAMPGLMKSWQDFRLYCECNLLAVERLLNGMDRMGVPRLIQISTSSVYGSHAIGDEDIPTRPVSPYGVTKLAAEHLVSSYANVTGISAIILRYFSIFGPRQRPDMAYNIFCNALLRGAPLTLYGDGSQSRSNTYVDDAVEATALAITHGKAGEVYNIAGQQQISLAQALNTLSEHLRVSPQITWRPARPGDQRETRGDARKAQRDLGWTAKTTIAEGLKAQADWQSEVFRDTGPK